jgi:hypothetical protein
MGSGGPNFVLGSDHGQEMALANDPKDRGMLACIASKVPLDCYVRIEIAMATNTGQAPHAVRMQTTHNRRLRSYPHRATGSEMKPSLP